MKFKKNLMHRIKHVQKFLYQSHLKSSLKMKVYPIPLLSDNYSYLIHGADANEAMLVDPSEGKPLIDYLSKNFSKISITHILLTHKHWDHTGGAQELMTYLNEQQKEQGTSKKIEIYAGALENLNYVTIPIKETTVFQITKDIKMTVYLAPCHTRGHVLYSLEGINEKGDIDRALFTGDTLFLGGCGRFFEGTAKEMLENFDLIASLPKDTNIFCGHEYTVSNLEWALGVEWENEAIEKKLKWAVEVRSQGGFTVPGSVGEEMEMNVFMRCRNSKIMEKFQSNDPVEVMQKMRNLKDVKGNLK